MVGKELNGLYRIKYRIFRITLPYSSESFIFSGTRRDAESQAKKIQKSLKWIYEPKIKEL